MAITRAAAESICGTVLRFGLPIRESKPQTTCLALVGVDTPRYDYLSNTITKPEHRDGSYGHVSNVKARYRYGKRFENPSYDKLWSPSCEGSSSCFQQGSHRLP